ncbi:MAG: hypothetical protein DRO67_00750 [Candidatus Asgardarchaeum californiense]|nr:MAG: hypothetical protein DRO67_00750 [Candidatus Asgardarchaeum californiense]
MIKKRRKGDLNVAYRPYRIDEVFGHDRIKNMISGYLENATLPHASLFTGPAGCVDCDTEFFTGYGWKKISEYTDGDLVMQYDTTTKIASLVKPLRYIKKSSDKLFHFKTKYGLDQCLSKDHRVLYSLRKSGLHTDSFESIMNTHEINKHGFNGKFLTSFNLGASAGIDMCSADLRIMVMIIADATIDSNRTKCCLNLKKKRKIDRAHKLLKEAGIEYSTLTQGDYTRFYFIPPIRTKEFDSYFYGCNANQLETISSEVVLWDGDQKNIFFTTSKQSADFIQYAFTVSGYRASINIDDRRINNRSITYRVIRSTNTVCGLSAVADRKTVISEYTPIDGYQYCFTVPSSYLVLRRNNCIFITGNCGKTTFARIVALGLNCETGVTPNPCCECSTCKSIIALNSLSVLELDGARTGNIDTVRRVLNDLPAAPFGNDRVRVLILDEAHKLSDAAEDALLKFLEDTPAHVYIILCTNEPQKLKEVIRQRCKMVQFSRLECKPIYELLEQVAQFEGMNYNSKILNKITEECEGTPRIALSFLQQINAEGSWTDEAVGFILSAGLEADQQEVIDMCRLLVKKHGQWQPVQNIFLKLVKKIPVETMRIAATGFLSGCFKRSTSIEDATRYAKCVELVGQLYYGPKPEHMLLMKLFRSYNIIHSGNDIWA